MTETAEPDRGMTLEIPVRWGDMDAMGHINNTIYFQYCEMARIRYGEELKLGVEQHGKGEAFGLVSAQLNFRRQMRYPGTVAVSVNVVATSRRSFTFRCVLRDTSDGQVVADGESVSCWVDYQQAKALPLPDRLLAAIDRLEHNPDLLRRD